MALSQLQATDFHLGVFTSKPEKNSVDYVAHIQQMTFEDNLTLLQFCCRQLRLTQRKER